MDHQEKLISRKERHKLKKRKRYVYRLLLEDGLILLIPCFLFPVFENIATFLFISSILILPFVTKQKIVMLFSNLFLLALLLMFLYLINFEKMNSDLNILLVLSLILVVLLIFLVQVFVIIIKVYSLETEKHPNVDKAKWYVKLLVKIIYYSNKIIDKVSLLLPLFYYAFITLLIIYLYAVLYNGLNYRYEIQDEPTGYYMNTELLMNGADDLGYNIYINYGSLFEQNDSTRIPIVDIRYDKSMQISDQLTSKEKQNMVLRDFVQNTLRVSLSEYTYFSSTTFYTVGYGDVEIKGRVPKLLAQSQMFVAGFFHVIFVPLFLFIITDYISKRRKRT
ncbi:hypothetical protein AMS62_23230 [Bacillus sp. FJAT-18019]|nr:hypothetical protein AMS62_23230 [Bacillus sp. FJAT-18019]